MDGRMLENRIATFSLKKSNPKEKHACEGEYLKMLKKKNHEIYVAFEKLQWFFSCHSLQLHPKKQFWSKILSM